MKPLLYLTLPFLFCPTIHATDLSTTAATPQALQVKPTHTPQSQPIALPEPKGQLMLHSLKNFLTEALQTHHNLSQRYDQLWHHLWGAPLQSTPKTRKEKKGKPYNIISYKNHGNNPYYFLWFLKPHTRNLPLLIPHVGPVHHKKNHRQLTLKRPNTFTPLLCSPPKIPKKLLDRAYCYAATLNHRAKVYCHLAQYDKALLLFEACRHIQEKHLGKRHPAYTTTLSHIGLAHRKQGQHPQALAHYKTCLTIEAEILGTTHPSYATTLCNIGVVYVELKAYPQALAHYKTCLTIEANTLGTTHPSYATTLNNIGSLYFKQRQYDQALKFFYSAKRIQKHTLALPHPDYSTTLANIAATHYKKKQYHKALRFFEKTRNLREKSLGLTHPSYAQTVKHITICHRKIQALPQVSR